MISVRGKQNRRQEEGSKGCIKGHFQEEKKQSNIGTVSQTWARVGGWIVGRKLRVSSSTATAVVGMPRECPHPQIAKKGANVTISTTTGLGRSPRPLKLSKSLLSLGTSMVLGRHPQH